MNQLLGSVCPRYENVYAFPETIPMKSQERRQNNQEGSIFTTIFHLAAKVLEKMSQDIIIE